MRRLSLFLAAWVLLLAPEPSRAAEPLLLGDGDRLLVFAPHPDDGILAAGGLIQEALLLDLPVQVCFFTMGDNNEIAHLFTRHPPLPTPGAVRSAGHHRRQEALAAATRLGLATNQLVFLGYPDTGSLEIWRRHWRTVPPFRSLHTRTTAVPYDHALTPGSAHAGEDILDDLLEVLREFRPTLVVAPHPADHNGDHRALDLFVRVALWTVRPEGIDPVLLSAPVHFCQWPEPRRAQPLRPAAPPHFLLDSCTWREFSLAPFQVQAKQAALRAHHSQSALSPAYLDSFIRKSELFAAIPPVALPGGIGSAEWFEEDRSRFRPDDALLEDVTFRNGTWPAIREQQAVETAAMGADPNRFAAVAVFGDGEALDLVFEFTDPLADALTLGVDLYGWRLDVPFGDMPKIQVTAGTEGLRSVADLNAALPDSAVEFIPAGTETLQLRVPLARLGAPDRILLGARLDKQSLPVDWIPWRILDLTGAPLSAAAFEPEPPAPARSDPPLPPPAVPAAPELPPPPQPAAPQPPAADPAPPAPPVSLVPRVRLPARPLPPAVEANEPVYW